jgi:hypothetical protein
MVKNHLGLCWYGLDDKPRVHYEQHIQIIGDLFAGDKPAPQKHTSQLARRFRAGQETAQLLPQLLPACGRSSKSGKDLVFCGHAKTFW